VLCGFIETKIYAGIPGIKKVGLSVSEHFIHPTKVGIGL